MGKLDKQKFRFLNHLHVPYPYFNSFKIPIEQRL